MTDNDSLASVHPYQDPDSALIDRALERIGNPHHRAVFYSRLENPKWVKALTARGAFARLPTSTVDTRGGASFQAWPQGEYLARMAPMVPGDVASALEPMKDADNPVVQRAVIDAASRMPADQARRLTKMICGYLARPTRSWLDPVKLTAVVTVLAEGGCLKEAKALAQAIYRPLPDDAPANDDGVALDGYWYAKTLPQVISALDRDPKTLAMVVIWLEQWTRRSGASEYGMRSMWRDAIEPGPHEAFNRVTYQVGHALVDAVHHVAHARIDAGESLGTVVSQIDRGDGSIFPRLALDVVTYALGRETQTASGALALACERLTSPDMLAGELRPEYVVLSRAALHLLEDDTLECWEQLIARPPHLAAEQVARRLGTGAEGVSAEQVEQFIGIWQRDLLAEIGRRSLPVRLQQTLDELIAIHGQPPPSAHTRLRDVPFIGPTSPLGDTDLAGLNPAELASYLGSWKPDPGFGFGPSRDGLARAVARLTAADPTPYAQAAGSFANLDSAYVTALADGLQQAVGHNRVFPWAPVLALIADCAARHGQESDHGAEEMWRFTLQHAADLIRAGFEPGPAAIDPTLFGAAWAGLEPITGSAHPTAAEEQAYGPPSTDALTFSLNAARPVALRAAIRLLLAVHQQLVEPDIAEQPGGGNAITSSILDALERHAGPNRDPSLTAAAVFGEALGTLLTAAPDWTLARLERLLGRPGVHDITEAEQAWFDTVWTVMLAGYRPSRGLYDPLKSWFLDRLTALGDGRPDAVSAFSIRSPKQSLADHVLALYVTGQFQDGLDSEALTMLFEFAEAPLVRNALGHLGWQLGQSQGEVPDSVVARFRSLWESRQARVEAGTADRHELLDFYWWVTSQRFEAAWWLPHLLNVAREPEFDPHQMLGEHLARAACDHPAQVLDVFAALHANGQTIQSYDLLTHAPEILRPAIASSDPDVVRRASALAEQLGRQGYVDLMDRIRSATS
jgi:hypothetical protein